MTEEKLIVIGCDDTVSLSAVLNRIKDVTSFAHNVISATRVSDLINISKSVAADLLILCFRNNQLALNDVTRLLNKPGLPILCLTRQFENSSLRWAAGSIVFTCPLEHINSGEYLSSRINSVFMLMALAAPKQMANNFAVSLTQIKKEDDSRNMSRYVLELDKKVEVLQKVKERIADLYKHVDERTRAELTSIINAIKLSANDNKLWDDFKLHFEQTNPAFLRQLSAIYPSLTPIDLKYCCYLKMNMSNDDIKNILGINQESVRTHKYRLKRKMLLPADLDLRTYLKSVG